MAEKLQAPFPYFGGKSMIADVIWQYLGCENHKPKVPMWVCVLLFSVLSFVFWYGIVKLFMNLCKGSVFEKIVRLF